MEEKWPAAYCVLEEMSFNNEQFPRWHGWSTSTCFPPKSRPRSGSPPTGTWSIPGSTAARADRNPEQTGPGFWMGNSRRNHTTALIHEPRTHPHLGPRGLETVSVRIPRSIWPRCLPDRKAEKIAADELHSWRCGMCRSTYGARRDVVVDGCWSGSGKSTLVRCLSRLQRLHQRQDRDRRARHHQPRAARPDRVAPLQDGHGIPVLRASCRTERCWTMLAFPLEIRGARTGWRGTNGQPRCCVWSGSMARRTTFRTKLSGWPAAAGGHCAQPGRRTRNLVSRTSRSRHWTR